MGAPVPDIQRAPVLLSSTLLAQYGGRAHEVLWQGNHNKVIMMMTVMMTMMMMMMALIVVVAIQLQIRNHSHRFIEDQEEKKERLVAFFRKNITNK